MKLRKIVGAIFAGLFGLSGLLTTPAHIFAQNDLLVASPGRNSVERFDGFTGAHLGSFASGIPNANGVTVGPDQNVYISSSQLNEVHRYNGQTGAFIDVFASGNGLFRPNEVTFHGDFMYVGEFASTAGDGVQRFDAFTGAYIDTFENVNSADGIEFTASSLLVSSFVGGVREYDLTTGAFLGDFINPGDGGLSGAVDLLFAKNGDLLVGSFFTGSVKRYTSAGVYIDDVITGLAQQEGLAYGLDGNLYAGSFGLGLINKYDADTYQFLGEFMNIGPNTNFFEFRPTAVPEPGSGIVLLTFGLIGFGRRRRR